MNIYLSMIVDALTSLGRKPYSCSERSCQFSEKSIDDPEILAIRPLSEGPGILTVREEPDGNVCCCCGHSGFYFSESPLIEILDLVLTAYDSYQTWSARLTEAVKKEADIQELANIGSDLIRNPFFIADWGGRVLAYSQGYEPEMFENEYQRSVWEDVLGKQLSVTVVERLLQSSNMDSVVRGRKPSIMTFQEYDYTCLIGTINTMGNINLYIQVMQFDQPLRQPTDCHLAEALLSAIRALPENKLPQIKNSVISLFSNLYDEQKVSNEDLNWAFVTLGWDKEKDFLLLRIRSNEGERLATAAEGQLKKLPNTISFVRNDEVILFMRQGDFSIYEQRMKSLSISLGLRIGISLPFNNWSRLLVQRNQAAAALDFASEDSVLCLCQDHLLDYLLQQSGQLIDLLQLCHPAVKCLHEYDAKNNSNFLETLSSYLSSERNASQTADLLFVHRNTIQYRVNRIKELTNVDLEDPDTRLYLQLSCHMFQPKIAGHTETK